MTEKVNDFYACMAGTGSAVPHCTALHGVVGERVTCTVYALRPAPCREVEPGDDKCNRARARHGLPKLTIEKADNSLKPLVGADFSHFSLCNSSALFGCNPLPVDYTC